MPLESGADIRALLEETKTIALVGASANPARDSHEVMAFLQRQGYRVIPVNPGLAGQQLLGETVAAGLAGQTIHGRSVAATVADAGPVDLVDIFRNSDAAGGVVDEAIAAGAKAVWMQLGVINHEAAARAEAAGLKVVMNHCPKVEIPKLGVRRT